MVKTDEEEEEGRERDSVMEDKRAGRDDGGSRGVEQNLRPRGRLVSERLSPCVRPPPVQVLSWTFCSFLQARQMRCARAACASGTLTPQTVQLDVLVHV